MAKALPKKLELFQMRSLRRRLIVKWSNVIDEIINNVSVRKNFNSIRNIKSLIAKERLFFWVKSLGCHASRKYLDLKFENSLKISKLFKH